MTIDNTSVSKAESIYTGFLHGLLSENRRRNKMLAEDVSFHQHGIS